MFRKWKCSVTTPIGMFEAWGLDRMLLQHRGRMNTFYREGKIAGDPEDGIATADTKEPPAAISEVDKPSDNPYLLEEHGGADTDENNEEIQEQPRDEMIYPSQKLYLKFIIDKGGIKRKDVPTVVVEDVVEKEEQSGPGIFEDWRQDQLPGMYAEWRSGKWSYKQQEQESRKAKAKREASASRVEAMNYEEATRATLNGDIKASRQVHKRALRLFICSTFTDTKAERHRLARDVFPYVRDVCTQKAIDFLPIDLGWGQADSATMDTEFSATCLAELERSSIGMFPAIGVLCFLTDKYGCAVLPESVPREEFDLLVKGVEDEDECRLVRRWYRLDENAVPPAYRLGKAGTGPTRIAPDKHERRALSARWTTTETYLMRILQAAVHNTPGLTEQQLEKWTLSPYHHLITRGILQNSAAIRKSMCVIRDIAQVQRPFSIPDSQVNSRNLELYVDMHPERNIPDPQSRSQLEQIRQNLKVKKIKCKKYLVNWSPFGVTENSHGGYVDHVVSTVGKQLVGRIKMALAGMSFPDDLLEEVASHSRFCIEQAEGFCGRMDVVSKILNFTSKPAKHEGRIMLVHGVKGAGKTAVMAKYGTMMRNHILELAEQVDPVLIIRFCKLTKQMTTVSLLTSICQQISRAYTGASLEHCPQDIKELSKLFADLLTEANGERPLVIMLDSVDDVKGQSPKDVLQWLPSVLPPHVQLILSVWSSSEQYNLLTKQAQMITEVGTLNKSEAVGIMRQLLMGMNRTLNKSQHDYIISGAVGKLAETPTVLRLKLLFDICKGWASYDIVTVFLHTVPSLYAAFLERLELEHGKLVVAHVLSFLLASHGGLSESELVDILSGDEELLNSVLLLNKPPVNRFPQSSLSKLLQSLSYHLSEVYSHGRTVIVFTNRQLEEAVHQRYIGTTMYMTGKYCKILASYYGGEMHDQLPGRKLAPQPLYWRDPESGQVLFNKAKLSELPLASIGGPYTFSVHDSLCNLTFIAAKCAAGMLRELLKDYDVAEEELNPDGKLTAYRDFVHQCGVQIADAPGGITSLALSLSSDNLVHIQTKDRLDRGEVVVPWVPQKVYHKERRISRHLATPQVLPVQSPHHISANV